MSHQPDERDEMLEAMIAADDAGIDIVPGGAQGGFGSRARQRREEQLHSRRSAEARSLRRVRFLTEATLEDQAA